MNNLHPEMMSELNRQRIKDELDAIRLEQKFMRVKRIRIKLIEQNLAVLGDWMIASGEKLRRRYATSQPQSGSTYLLHEMSDKIGA